MEFKIKFKVKDYDSDWMSSDLVLDEDFIIVDSTKNIVDVILKKSRRIWNQDS